MAEERISELEDMTIETSKSEKQEEKTGKNKQTKPKTKTRTEYPRTVGQLQKV